MSTFEVFLTMVVFGIPIEIEKIADSISLFKSIKLVGKTNRLGTVGVF